MTALDDEMRAALRSLAHEEFAQGRAGLLRIVGEAPEWADAWALLGGAHLAMADVPASTAASERAMALAPDRFLPQMKAGELALRLGHVARAEDLFLAALRSTEPDTSDAVAAKRALAIARAANRAGIAHRASLPGTDRFRRLLRPLRLPLGSRPSTARVEVGTEIGAEIS